jgi:hypothetical protein
LRLSEPQGIAWLEGLGKLKDFTSTGLETTTFRLVTQYLNHYTRYFYMTKHRTITIIMAHPLNSEMGIKSNSGAHTLPYRGLQADHTIPQNLDGR